MSLCIRTVALIWLCCAALPLQAQTPQRYQWEEVENTAPALPSFTPYLAIDVNGNGGTFRGLTWHAESAVQSFSMQGDPRQAVGLALSPSAEPAQEQMLKYWRQHFDTTLSLADVPWGTYDIYMYFVQSMHGEAGNFTVHHAGIQTPLRMPGMAGQWFVAGPFRMQSNDQYMLSITVKGFVNIAGIEVWQVNE